MKKQLIKNTMELARIMTLVETGKSQVKIGDARELVSKLEEVILKWQRKWMDVQGTNEQDRKNYFERSAGIDANMRFSLARMIGEWVKKEIGA